MKKLGSLLLVLTLGMALLAGCSTGASSSVPAASSSVAPQASSAAEETVTDMLGREVAIPAAVDRIVAVTASDCEILFALGVGDRLVGRGEYCDYPPEVLDIESVGSGNETNVEQILALSPQVVFMSSMAQDSGPVEQLEKAGIAVVISEAVDIAGVYTSIELIGKVVGKEAEAATLVADMQQGFADIVAQIPEQTEKSKVYFEVSPLEYGLWTSGNDTFMNEIAEMLQLENVFSDVSGWAEISQEQVIERDPDYIITITMYFGEGPLPDEEIKSREGWQNITAVANNHVFAANEDELARPGPRLVQGAQSLFDLIYTQ